MQGFQVTFFTEQGRRHGHQRIDQWLRDIGTSASIRGITTALAVEGTGRDGKLHSAHFIELIDQPIEITIALTQAQCESLFARLEWERANLFYAKTPVEFGVVGEIKMT